MSFVSLRASILLAVPQMQDPNFMHSAVLICTHAEEGAFGFVLNRFTGVRLKQLSPDHPLLGELDFPIALGGPVGHSSLQFMHRCPERIPGGHHLAQGLYLGGEIDAMAQVLRDDPRAGEQVRLFLGHSGWSAGQLDCEMASGSWVCAPLALDLVFSTDTGESLWRRALRDLGKEGEQLSHLPPDPTWN